MLKGIKSKLMGGAPSAPSAPPEPSSEKENPIPPETPQPSLEKHRRLEDMADSGESFLSARSSFKGDLSGPAGARIAGEVQGNIRCEGLIRTEETAKIKGNVYSPHVILEGELEGDICSAVRVELRSKAKMRGNIETQELAIAEGCFFEGQISMGTPEAQPVRFKEKRHPEAAE
jgi:cytoskeletal protein CcmA (bactofilin family)